MNPGSVIGTRARDSHTCGVLTLPTLELEIFALDDGRRVPFAEGPRPAKLEGCSHGP